MARSSGRRSARTGFQSDWSWSDLNEKELQMGESVIQLIKESKLPIQDPQRLALDFLGLHLRLEQLRTTKDPCPYSNDGECDVPTYCEHGDYADCAGAIKISPTFWSRRCDMYSGKWYAMKLSGSHLTCR